MKTVALAGRRIDKPDAAERRFPASNVDKVEERLAGYFRVERVQHLVCSAACGADLLALEAAGEAGISRTIILPFDVDTFRETSVTIRPGEWSRLYDEMIRVARASGTLVLLGCNPEDEGAYETATQAIITEVARYEGEARACIVWEGATRGGDDHSMSLAETARARGWPVDEIPTL